jgi:DNA invertase Pin-like site-specific DNA recombinase
MEAGMQTMDGYVRVSRVMGRDGDSYMSPTIQRDDIRRWAERADVRIGEWVEEQDVSGGKAIKDRELAKLIHRVERGQSQGVVVRTLDRFGRDSLDAAVNIKRLTDAGARLVAIHDGVDTGPGGSSKIALAVQLAIAEDYLDRVRLNWRETKRRNVEERGLHTCATPPVGYVRRDEAEPTYHDGALIRDAKLVVEPVAAARVVRAFEMRAAGHTFAQVFRETGIRGRAFTNAAYLGTATNGDFVREGAHEAIVTPELYAAANVRHRPRRPNDGTLSAQALLSGLVKCAACGSKMWVRGKGRDGSAFYHCSKSKAGGCPSPAASNCRMVDDHVLWLVANDPGSADAASTAEQRFLEAQERVREGEADLDRLVAERGDLGLDAWRRMVVSAEAALDQARAALYELPDPGLPQGDVAWLDGRPVLLAAWDDLTMDEKRTHLRRYVGSVTVRSCGKAGRWTPIGSRVAVKWVDGSEPVLADDTAADAT